MSDSEAEVLRRTVFCVSDHTGVTAETFAHSLMSRFESVVPAYITRPFVDTVEKARELVDEIDQVAGTGERPIVFSTLTDKVLWDVLHESEALVLGMFEFFVDRLSSELDVEASKGVGRYHSINDTATYQLRLDAVDFALMTDDGVGLRHYPAADVVLVGVSRVGKTPTCLYLSMQYGIRAANYPLTVDDPSVTQLPEAIAALRDRLFGLTIDPIRLHQIRQKRRPDSPYSSLERCTEEVGRAERLLRSNGVATLDTTARSIEEITATIIEEADLVRRLG